MSVSPDNKTKKLGSDLKNVIEDVGKDLEIKGRIPIWPAFIAFALVAGLFSLLSEQLTIGPSWLLLLVVGVFLMVAVTLWLQQNHRFSRVLGRAMTALVTLALAVGVFLLVLSLPTGAIRGPILLRDAAILWVSNVIIFGLWYWEIDGDGPGARHLKGYTPTDFLFPQVLAGEEFTRNWKPGFIDYMYLAFNTNTAFSPTDTSVLSRRAKVLMMCQSVLALITIAVIAARAINIIPNNS